MKIIFYEFSNFLLILLCFSGVSLQLDCNRIPDTDQTAGKVLNIPNNSTDSVVIPVNFNCTYTIKPPRLVYAQITLTNNLAGDNDVITVTDGQQKITKVDRRYQKIVVFYVFPLTTTTVNIQNFDASSKFYMTVNYTTLPTPEQRALQKGQNLNYFPLNLFQKKPLSLSSDGPISLTLAKSIFSSDSFDNYFLIDGDLNNPRSIKKLVDFQSSNFNTSTNVITIVGLDDVVSHSSIILNPSSQLNGFSKFAGVTVEETVSRVNVTAINGQKIGVMIVAKDSQQLVLNKIILGEGEICKSVSVTGPPTVSSKPLIDFKNDQYSLPQLFPYPYFSIIVENCNAQFDFTTLLPTNYYNLDNDRSGFIFSPIYFNDEATNGYMNITFAYNGDEKRQFVVDVDRVTVGSSNSELDINIYDSGWKKTLSTVITGNQEGTRSRAFGSYLNVQMFGYTAARLHWSLSSFSSSYFNLSTIICIISVIMMISK